MLYAEMALEVDPDTRSQEVRVAAQTQHLPIFSLNDGQELQLGKHQRAKDYHSSRSHVQHTWLPLHSTGHD